MIRRGELDIQVPSGLSRVPVCPAEPAQQLTYGEQIAARIVHQELRRDQNLEKIAYYTTEEEGDGEVAKERDLDEEWLTQFFPECPGCINRTTATSLGSSFGWRNQIARFLLDRYN
jgi:hypothetical protein